MKTKLILPVIDTERGEFKYNGRQLTREEFGDMEYRHFLETNSQMEWFTDNIRRGVSNINPYANRMREVRNVEHPDIYFNDEEIEVILYDARRNEVDEEFLLEHARKGDMFILLLNINSNTLTGDGESETRFWMEDSQKVLNDDSLPEEMKLKTLPGRDYTVFAGKTPVLLKNCKMVANYSNKRYPFYIGLIVEKAVI